MNVLQKKPSEKIQILSKEGKVLPDTEPPDLTDDELEGMYRDMVLARTLDRKAIKLQRQGRMGTYPPLEGQEGAQIGSAYALDTEDWVVPSYREHGTALVMGLEPSKILLYWMGDERGNKIPSDINIFTVSVPIATHIPHATGMAWASKLKKEEKAFLCYFGDGATSEGDFHEGLNFAGVFNTPTVFFCNNNQYAISVPRERQTASQTIAQKANAYGFKGVQVDGMDPLAVYRVTREAVEKAKKPDNNEQRPTLIEAVQYRFGAHTTADDPSKYRNEDEVEEWRKRDPLTRMENYLKNTGRMDDEALDAVRNEAKEVIEEAVSEAESQQEPEPEDMFRYVYSETPTGLQEQMGGGSWQS